MSESDEPTVCPDHLRFVPCRHCEPGQEKFSTDPVDVGRVLPCSHGHAEPCPAEMAGRVQSVSVLILMPCGHDHRVQADAPMSSEQRAAEKAKPCPHCVPRSPDV